MIAVLSPSTQRFAVAITISLLLHGWLIREPNFKLPLLKSDLPPLIAKLEPLPNFPARPKPRKKPEPKTAPLPQKISGAPPPSAAEANPTPVGTPSPTETAASAVAVTEILAPPLENKPVDRPLLPHHARLTFAVNNGTSDFRVGEAVHTLEIEEGHYVLQSVTQTVGLAKLFKNYQITQYSSGSYNQSGLQPEQFFEERSESAGTHRYTAEFDQNAKRAYFSNGGEAELLPDTQDILSILYQLPPLHGVDTVPINISNGKKIEHYKFEVSYDETTPTPIGKLHTVHLHKVHTPNQEGLDIWLAQEYRLFPVKMSIIEKGGEISGEIIITEILVEGAPEKSIPLIKSQAILEP